MAKTQRRKRAGPGRPPFKPSERRTKIFTVKLSPREREALDANAEAMETTASALAVEAMRAAGLFRKPRKRAAQ